MSKLTKIAMALLLSTAFTTCVIAQDTGDKTAKSETAGKKHKGHKGGKKSKKGSSDATTTPPPK